MSKKVELERIKIAKPKDYISWMKLLGVNKVHSPNIPISQIKKYLHHTFPLKNLPV